MSIFPKENPFTIIWKIENFSLWMMESGLSIVSDDANIQHGILYQDKQWIVFVKYKLNQQENVDMDGTMEVINGENSLIFEGEPNSGVVNNGFFVIGRCLNSLNINKKRDVFLKRDIVPNDDFCIKISIWGTFRILSNLTSIFSRSEVEVEKFKMGTWTIKKFSSCTIEKKILNFSPGNKFELTLISTSEKEIKISIKDLEEIGATEQSKWLIIQISLINLADCIRFSTNQVHKFDKKIKKFKFPFLKKSILIETFSDCLINDELSLICDIVISNREVKHDPVQYIYKNKYSVSEMKYFKNKNSDIEALMYDGHADSVRNTFKNMYISKILTDIVFQIDGETLPAHKCVLAASSPVFKAMFEQDLLESKSGVVDIQDISYDIMNMMLIYLYGETSLAMDCKSASELMIAADKYQIKNLKEKCSSFLKSELSVERVCDTLVLSDMLLDEDMKNSAIEYLKDNKKDVLLSPEWKKLLVNNSRLAAEVLNSLVLLDK